MLMTDDVLTATAPLQNVLMATLRQYDQGERDGALTTLQNLTELHPSDYRVWWALANVSERQDERRLALQAVLRLNPMLEEAHEKLERLTMRRR